MKELDERDAAIRVAGVRRNRDGRRLGVEGALGGADDGNGGRIVLRVAGQFESKGDVGTGDRLLMNLRSENIRTCHQIVQRNVDDIRHPSTAVIACRSWGGRQIADVHCRQIVPKDFLSVEVNNDAIIPLNPHRDHGILPRVRHRDGLPVVGGDELIGRVRTEGVRRGLVAIPIPQLPRSAGPRAVVEGRSDPAGAKVGPGVEILPDGIGRHERIDCGCGIRATEEGCEQ